MTRRLWAVEACIEEGCDTPPLARSLCSKHYQRRKLRGEALPAKVRAPLAGVRCAVPGCEGRAVARGLCPSHSARARRYGLSVESLASVDEVVTCDICGAPPRHVDHDHVTGRVRGILCHSCNTGLGHFRSSQILLATASAYLDRADAARPD